MTEDDTSHRVAVRVWVGAALVVVLSVVAASSASTDLWVNPNPTESTPTRPAVEAPPEDEPEPPTDGSFDWPDLSWILDVVSVLAFVLLVVGIVLAVSDRQGRLWNLRWRFRRRKRAPKLSAPRDFQPAPVEVDVEAASEALEAGTPRNGIVACWMQLERDAAEVGLERLAAETSAEYAERVVASSSVDPGPIGDLAALYREARFSRHELDDGHRTRARRALDGVAAELRAGAKVGA